MGSKHCGKHDIVFPEGGECWCCKQEKEKSSKPSQESPQVPTVVATGGK